MTRPLTGIGLSMMLEEQERRAIWKALWNVYEMARAARACAWLRGVADVDDALDALEKVQRGRKPRRRRKALLNATVPGNAVDTGKE